MSSDAAITVAGLSKRYRIFSHPGDRLKQAATLGRLRLHREFTALEDVSFEIPQGQTVGIIGRNGSGKSTLLQLICGILKPSAGTVQTRGRVAALLELGAGFNPEFTGRENVYFQGALMGMSRADMDARFDAIAAFADIGAFMDQPVRTYSSGMFVRLAFAVANSLEPDILVVDEALAVGDEAFKRKCFARFRSFREGGGVLLFVSHSSNMITDLCDRALLLDSGRLLFDGSPKGAVAWYQKLLYAPPARRAAIVEQIRHLAGRAEVTAPLDPAVEGTFDPDFVSVSLLEYESQGAYIRNPRVRDDAGRQVNVLQAGETYHFCYEVAFDKAATGLMFGMMIKLPSGVQLGGISVQGESAEAGEIRQVALPFRCHLARGTYFLNAGVFGSTGDAPTYLHRIIDAVMLRVEGSSPQATGAIDFTVS